MANERRPNWKQGAKFARRALGRVDADKVHRRITWMNANAEINGMIDVDAVSDTLGELGDGASMRLLKELEQKGNDIRDPTAYIIASARRSLSGESEGKLRKRILWLNDHLPESEDINLDAVMAPLLDLGLPGAYAVLKDFETNVGEVRNPTAYVLSKSKNYKPDPSAAAAAVAKPQRPRQQKPGRPDGPPRRPLKSRAAGKSAPATKRVIKTITKDDAPKQGKGRDQRIAQRIQKRVEWLNEHSYLVQPIEFDEVVSVLVDVGHPTSMAILKELEENALDIENPTNFILDRASQAEPEEHDHGPERHASLPPPPRPERPPRPHQGGHVEEKLWKRVDWLNGKGGLSQPIEFSAVVELLSEAGLGPAFEILKNLEEQADRVRNPTAWVRSNTINVLEGRDPPPRGGKGGDVREPPPAPPAFGGGGGGLLTEEKLAKRVNWLNANVPMSGSLDLDKIAPDLMDLDSRTAMDILKNFQDASEDVRNPTSYVIASARRARNGQPPEPPAEARGRKRKRPQEPLEEPERRIAPRTARNGAPPPAPPAAKFGPGLRENWTRDDKEHASREWLRNRLTQKGRSGDEPVSYYSMPASLSRGGKGGRDANRGRAGTGRMALPPAPPPIGSAPPRGGGHSANPPDVEDKLRKRITWLNNRAGLSGPLDFERVAGPLLTIQLSEAYDILKRLEESAAEVRDPVKYVNAAVRRAESGGGGLPPPPRRGGGRKGGGR